jgi:hypothetical protein
VIFAAKVVAEHLTAGQGHGAMAAAIFQRGGTTVGTSIKDNGLIQERSPNRFFPDFCAPGRDVPGIVKEHLPTPLKAATPNTIIN